MDEHIEQNITSKMCRLSLENQVAELIISCYILKNEINLLHNLYNMSYDNEIIKKKYVLERAIQIEEEITFRNNFLENNMNAYNEKIECLSYLDHIKELEMEYLGTWCPTYDLNDFKKDLEWVYYSATYIEPKFWDEKTIYDIVYEESIKIAKLKNYKDSKCEKYRQNMVKLAEYVVPILDADARMSSWDIAKTLKEKGIKAKRADIGLIIYFDRRKKEAIEKKKEAIEKK